MFGHKTFHIVSVAESSWSGGADSNGRESGRWLVYALYNENKVAIADPAARKVAPQIALPEQPVLLKLSRDGSLAFGSSSGASCVKSRRSRLGPDPVMEMPSQ